MTHQFDTRMHIDRLERQVRQLKTFVGALTVGLAMMFAAAWAHVPAVQAQSDNRILRVRGIIVEDEAGRERVLIGAPIPAAANRVRTNDRRVRELWAGRFPDADQYMEFYKGYQHSTNGMLILDENGFDRIAVGDPVPDLYNGKRIGPNTGMIINDERGSERSGYGLLKVGATSRVVLGLDFPGGRDVVRGGDGVRFVQIAANEK